MYSLFDVLTNNNNSFILKNKSTFHYADQTVASTHKLHITVARNDVGLMSFKGLRPKQMSIGLPNTRLSGFRAS